MYQDINKQWLDLCKVYSDQFISLNELTAKTVNEIASSKSVDELMNANQPSDIASAMLKIAMDAQMQSIHYIQQALNIMMQTSADFNKRFSSMASDAVKRTKSEAREMQRETQSGSKK